jgi:hypothetical protein
MAAFLNGSQTEITVGLLVHNNFSRSIGVGPGSLFGVNLLLSLILNTLWHFGHYERADRVVVDTRWTMIMLLVESFHSVYELAYVISSGKLYQTGISMNTHNDRPVMGLWGRTCRFLAGATIYAVLIMLTVLAIVASQPANRGVDLSEIRGFGLEREGTLNVFSEGNYTTHSFSRNIEVKDAGGAVKLDRPILMSVARHRVDRLFTAPPNDTTNKVTVLVAEQRKVEVEVLSNGEANVYKFRVELFVEGFNGSLNLNCSKLLGTGEQTNKDRVALEQLLSPANVTSLKFEPIDRLIGNGTTSEIGWTASWKGKTEPRTLGAEGREVALGDIIVAGLLETVKVTALDGPQSYRGVYQGDYSYVDGISNGRVATDEAPRLTLVVCLLIFVALQLAATALVATGLVRCAKFTEAGLVNEVVGGDCRANVISCPVMQRQVNVFTETPPQGIMRSQNYRNAGLTGHVGLFQSWLVDSSANHTGIPISEARKLMKDGMLPYCHTTWRGNSGQRFGKADVHRLSLLYKYSRKVGKLVREWLRIGADEDGARVKLGSLTLSRAGHIRAPIYCGGVRSRPRGRCWAT